jgi:hypothetical protein
LIFLRREHIVGFQLHPDDIPQDGPPEETTDHFFVEQTAIDFHLDSAGNSLLGSGGDAISYADYDFEDGDDDDDDDDDDDNDNDDNDLKNGDGDDGDDDFYGDGDDGDDDLYGDGDDDDEGGDVDPPSYGGGGPSGYGGGGFSGYGGSGPSCYGAGPGAGPSGSG